MAGEPVHADHEDLLFALLIAAANVEDVRVPVGAQGALRAAPLLVDKINKHGQKRARVLEYVVLAEFLSDLVVDHVLREAERLSDRSRSGLLHLECRRENSLPKPFADPETFTGLEKGGERVRGQIEGLDDAQHPTELLAVDLFNVAIAQVGEQTGREERLNLLGLRVGEQLDELARLLSGKGRHVRVLLASPVGGPRLPNGLY